MSKSDPRDALHDIVYGLKSVFAQYNRTARKKAWDVTQKPEGKRLIDSLLLNPSRPVVGLPRLLKAPEHTPLKGKFKEWLDTTQA